MAQVNSSTANSLLVLGSNNGKGRGFTGQKDRPSSGGSKKYYMKREDSSSSLEVLPPDDEKGKKNHSSKIAGGSNKRSTSGSRPGSSNSSRPSSSRSDTSRPSSSSKRAPPIGRLDSSLPRRTPTPTKQIALQAVRRKENVDESFSSGSVDWSVPLNYTATKPSQTRHPKNVQGINRSCDMQDDFERLSVQSESSTTNCSSHTESCDTHSATGDSSLYMLYTTSADSAISSFATGVDSDMTLTSAGSSVATASRSETRDLEQALSVPTAARSMTSHQAWPDPEECGSTSVSRVMIPGSTVEPTRNASNNSSGAEPMPKVVDIEDSDEFDTDLSEGEGAEEEGEAEKVKAPNELLMEFLTCVMEQDYENAQKLCKMILIYEPDNPEAVNFQNLIEEKMLLDEEETDTESDSDDDEEGSDYDSDDSSSGDDDDDDDESSDEDDNQSDGMIEDDTKPDSGVASANEGN